MKRFLDWATSSFQDDFNDFLSALIAALIAIIFFCLSFSVANASTTTIQVVNGGTGTSTTPSYGQLLIGGHNSEYEFISTSTLNLTTSAFPHQNISQWTNNAGYLISESDPLSLHLTTWYATTSARLRRSATSHRRHHHFGNVARYGYSRQLHLILRKLEHRL